jgi:hypothetical protein
LKADRPIQRKIIFYVFYSSIVIIVLLIAAELILRFLDLPTAQLSNTINYTNDERNYVLKPNAHVKFTGLHDELKDTVTWHINTQGLRENEFIPPKTSRNCRVATYGDSETFGWSVNHSNTFQKQLELIDNSYECINLGVPGYNVCQIAAHIDSTGQFINPDIIIYVVNPNDVDPPLHISKMNSNFELLRRVKFAYEMIQVYRNERKRRSPVAISTFIDGLVRIKRHCETENTKLILAFIDRDDFNLLHMNRELSDYFLTPGTDSLKMIDLSPVFKKHKKVDCHLCCEGHRDLAKLLYDKLIRINGIVNFSFVMADSQGISPKYLGDWIAHSISFPVSHFSYHIKSPSSATQKYPPHGARAACAVRLCG